MSNQENEGAFTLRDIVSPANEEETTAPANTGDDSPNHVAEPTVSPEQARLNDRVAAMERLLEERTNELRELKDKVKGDSPEAELVKERESKTELEKELRETRAKFIAAEVGSVDPELVALLVDWSKVKDHTSKEEIKSEVNRILEEKPHLKPQTRSNDIDAGRTGDAGGPPSDDPHFEINRRIRERAGIVTR